MASKVNKKDLLEALKDPDLLKEAGLVKMTDQEEKELFSDIEVGDDDDIQSVTKKFNERQRKQRDFYKKQQADTLKAAKAEAGAGEKARKDKEVASFLKDHPELSSNKELLDMVEPLYANGMELKDAYNRGCKALDLDPSTGKPPASDDDKKKAEDDKKDKKEKKSALKSDVTDTDRGDGKDEDKDDTPKSIREIASEQLNQLTAKGENPWSTQTEN